MRGWATPGRSLKFFFACSVAVYILLPGPIIETGEGTVITAFDVSFIFTSAFWLTAYESAPEKCLFAATPRFEFR